MHGLALLLAAASVGVDYGWQPGPDGALEYIIQLEPELISALKKGEAIMSEIHPDAHGVRRFRIQIGTEPLPRIAGQPATSGGEAAETSDAQGPPQEPAPNDGSAFPIEDYPAASVPFQPGEFPLSPLPKTSLPSTDNEPAAPEDRGGAFPVSPGEAEQPPVNAPTSAGSVGPSTDQPVPSNSFDPTPKTQKPIPLPDPDRLPLEPATLPITATDAPRQAISLSAGTTTTPQLASFDQQEDQKATTSPKSRKKQKAPIQSASRPWFLFSVTILALLGSLGANAYLGYLFFGLQQRYQGLRREQRQE